MEIAVREAVQDPAELQRQRDAALSPLALAAIRAGMSDKTWAVYSGWWNDFLAWCRREERTPLPATGETLAEYLTYLCYTRVVEGGPYKGQIGLSCTTVGQARWAVVKAHKKAGAPVPDLDPSLEVVRGYKKRLAEARDPRMRARKATPATPSDLQKLAELPTDGPAGLRDRCLVLLWYSIAARVSDIVSLNIEDIADGGTGLTVTLYRQKTDLDAELAIPAEDAPQAVAAFRAWRDALAQAGRTSGPLFVRFNKWGGAATASGSDDGRLSLSGAQGILKQAFSRAGLEGRWSGHSMRRGFATAARLAGHDNITIAKQTGHHPGSPVLLGYMDDADKWTRNALKGCGV